ncbi:hypothetical protein V8G54_003835 [Vigna mungo]|uniref:Retrotransposon gag domain-containing protein n=1 Tax=Vigna mungo TaxID=3915 RepID=A0AAQ3SE93_VIGMU
MFLIIYPVIRSYLDRTPKKDGPVNQQEIIIERARPKIWNVYVRRKKVGLGKEIGKKEVVSGLGGESSSVLLLSFYHWSDLPDYREELALLSMPPKMSDHVEALKERLLAMEVSVRETLGEFRRLMLEEFTKLRNEQGGDHRDLGAEYRMAAKKVELPSLDGSDPVGWITRAETYFEVQGSTEEVKVRLAKLSMEGATIHWFNLIQETEVGLSWTKLKRELIGRYGGRTSDNPFEELKDLSQTGSVDEYLAEFEYISSQVYRLPEEQYLGYFIGGLVRTFNPVNRLQAMHLARDVEAEMQGEGFQRGGGGEKFGTGSGQGPNSETLGVGLGPNQSTQTKPSVGSSSPHESSSMTQQGSRVSGDRSPAADRNCGTKHLPYSELINRKAQGLCFRCGEKYHPLHRCTERQLRMVVLADDKTVNEAGEVVASEMREGEDDRTLECGSIELFAEVEAPWDGQNCSSTLRIKGSLNGVTLEVLIDSGASHNFISPHVVAALEISALGLYCGKMWKVNVQLGEFSTTVEPYVLELEDIDMILGISWLQRFGKVTFDWEEMTLSFFWQDKYLELQGRKLKKYEAMSPTGLVQPLPISDIIWKDISLGFLTGLPKSKRFQAILVVVDGLSKYGHLISLKHPYTEIEVFRLQGTILKMNSSSHLETDGQTEVIRQCLEAYLRCWVSEQPKNWSYRVPWAEIGNVFYKMQLLDSAKVYPVFHISQMKKAIGNHAVKPTLPTKLGLEEEDQEEPEAAVAIREIPEGGTITKQWLVKWKGRTEEEAIWKDEGLLQSQFPYFSLENKAIVAGGSNDRTPKKDGPEVVSGLGRESSSG